MKDDELRRLVERSEAELHALYDISMGRFRESRFMVDFLFTDDEKKAWLRDEPNFPKPIAT